MIHVSPELNAQDDLIRVNITVDAKEWKRFQELVHRGANLWADAPDFIKRAADLITNGKVMQDYSSKSGENRE